MKQEQIKEFLSLLDRNGVVEFEFDSSFAAMSAWEALAMSKQKVEISCVSKTKTFFYGTIPASRKLIVVTAKKINS